MALPPPLEPHQLLIRRLWAGLVLAYSWWIALVSGWGLVDPSYRWVGWLFLALSLAGSWFAIWLIAIRGPGRRRASHALAWSLPVVEAVYGIAAWIQG